MANLTLPPEVGRKYFFRYLPASGSRTERDTTQLYECEIVRTESYEKNHTTNPSKTGFVYLGVTSDGDNWFFWPDGEAKRGSAGPVCCLVEDLVITPTLPVSEEFQELQDQHEERMTRLRQLGA